MIKPIIAVLCPAKINLGLEVLERDPASGYHRIASVMQAISLRDRLEISLASNSTDSPLAHAGELPRIDVSGPFASEVPAENNSLLSAWAMLGGHQAFPAL
jgi:4-diphosphocytidyl-2C-methyl-D-erythritol kinase